MIKVIENILKRTKNKRFGIIALEKEVKQVLQIEKVIFKYQDFAEAINELVAKEKIKPIYSSKKNVMQPSLYRRYTKVSKEIKTVPASELISYHPAFNVSYFKYKHLDYSKYKPCLQMLSDYFKNEDNEWLSVNERSLEIFDDEKFLSSKDGEKLLSIIGISLEDLKCDKTYEPFFYYETRQSIRNVLIIENKDTFDSFKRLMKVGFNQWAGIIFQMLIYGEGNKITKSIHYAEEIDIPMEANFYYFGDIDKEGVAIKARLDNQTERKIEWMEFFYHMCWEEKKNTKRLSPREQRWNKRSIESFLSIFDEAEKEKVYQFIKKGYFIPQETLNRKKLRELGKRV